MGIMFHTFCCSLHFIHKFQHQRRGGWRLLTLWTLWTVSKWLWKPLAMIEDKQLHPSEQQKELLTIANKEENKINQILRASVGQSHLALTFSLTFSLFHINKNKREKQITCNPTGLEVRKDANLFEATLKFPHQKSVLFFSMIHSAAMSQ